MAQLDRNFDLFVDFTLGNSVLSAVASQRTAEWFVYQMDHSVSLHVSPMSA